jgi:exonuclease III
LHFCNINGLLAKRNQIKTVLSKSPAASVLALCETHVDKNYKGSIKVKDYVVHSFPHTNKSSGLCAYVHRSLPGDHLVDLNYEINGSMCMFVDVCLGPTVTVRICVVYVKPVCKIDDLRGMLDHIRAALEGGRPCLMLGDFNCRHSSLGDTVSTTKGELLVEFCSNHNLVVLNTKDQRGVPTRLNSVLDLCMTNRVSLFSLANLS